MFLTNSVSLSYVIRNREILMSICIHMKQTMRRVSLFLPFTHTQWTSNHCADGVEIGVKAHNFPFSSFCVCVVHGILKSGLSVVVLVDRASCVLRFICFSGGCNNNKKRGCTLVARQYPNYLPSFQSNNHASIILVWTAAVGK